MPGEYVVVAASGTLATAEEGSVRFPHAWTEAGVTVSATFTGAHLMHLAVAACVLNDLYREAAELGLALDGVKVTASGGFDADSWASSGVGYEIEIDSAAPHDQLAAVVLTVDAVAEIPRALRAGMPVKRA